jgi:hypothetical protein
MEDCDYPEEEWDIDPSMEEQIKIQAQIESYEQIDQDVANGIKPF